jgi:glycosyltransferase involved in cell wall biosynthesis
MKSNPLVSILIPAYNSEKWIRATIKSALAQTWPNKEIILVDDGSKDNTYKVAKEFESKLVKVVTQVNGGASSARNKALSLSNGDFIQWLDSDDILAPDKIERQLAETGFNVQTRTVYTSAWGFFYYSLRRAKFIENNLWQNLSPVEWLMHHLGDGNFMFPAVWLISRKLTEIAGPWDESLSYNDDGEYFSRVVASSEKVCFVTKALSYHRSGNIASLSNTSMSDKAFKSLDRSVNLCVDYLLRLENSERTIKAAINALQDVINSIYKNNCEIAAENQKKIIELGGSFVKPSRSNKFTIVQNLLGMETTASLKTKLWNMEIILRRSWDKMFYTLNREDKI